MGIPRWLRGVELWWVGVAVRRDWPDGSHDMFGWQLPGADLASVVGRDRRSWARGPARPTYSVVTLSARDFLLHGRRDVCRAPDCPTEAGPARAVAVPGGRAIRSR